MGWMVRAVFGCTLTFIESFPSQRIPNFGLPVSAFGLVCPCFPLCGYEAYAGLALPSQLREVSV